MEYNIDTTACFTGHRPEKLGGYERDNPVMNRLRVVLRERIAMAYEAGIRTFISGMALGLDQLAAELVLEARAVHGDIRLVAAVPFDGQEGRWPVASQKHYHKLIQLADDCVVVCEGAYAAWKMQKRNEWMIDRSYLVIAVWDGSTGGTFNAVMYARSAKHRPAMWYLRPVVPMSETLL